MIGLILSVFTIFNKPSEEELQAEKARVEQESKDRGDAEESIAAKDVVAETTNNSDSTTLVGELNANESNDSTQVAKTIDNKDSKGEIIRIENEKLIIDFNTKGGQIAAVRLKEYETFKEYSKFDDKHEPLAFFKKGDATNSVILPMLDGTEVNTANELFTVKQQGEDFIIFQWKKTNKEVIEFAYTFKKDAYDIDYKINIRGFAGKSNSKERYVQLGSIS